MTQKIEDVKPLACGISHKTDIDQCSITASASPGTVTVKFVGENGETTLILDQAIADGFADALKRCATRSALMAFKAITEGE